MVLFCHTNQLWLTRTRFRRHTDAQYADGVPVGTRYMSRRHATANDGDTPPRFI